MTLSRREFIGSVPAVAAMSRLAPEGIVNVQSDPLGVRKDFAVVDEGTYLDSAYITPSPRQSVEAAQAFAEAKGRGPVDVGAMLHELSEVHSRFSRLVGASEREIGILAATSEGENVVSRALDLGPDDNVVIDDLHYETTYVLYQHLAEDRGVEVRIVPNRSGAVPVEAFAEHVDDRTRLVSVAWVSHQNGYHHDLAPLAELAHAHGAYLYADAIQGIGMLDLDVGKVGVDFFTTGTYKWLLGGFGIAPFFVREELLDLVSVDRHGWLQIAEELGGHRYRLNEGARKYEYASVAFGAVFQLNAGLEYLLEVGVPNIERHTVALAQRLRAGLAEQGYDVWTPSGNRSAIVTFGHGRDAVRVRRSLDAEGIKLSFKANDTQLRAGMALFNTDEEIDRLLTVTGEWVE